MQSRTQIVAIIGAAVLLLVVLELVRRRRLLERYALLWLLSAVVLLALASWRDGLEKVARTIGIVYPPNALFLIGIGFILLLLLHFSSAVSRLSDQTKVLAQRLALSRSACADPSSGRRRRRGPPSVRGSTARAEPPRLTRKGQPQRSRSRRSNPASSRP